MRETDPYEHLAHLVAQAQTGDRNAFEEAYRLTAQAQFFSIAAKTNAEVAPDLLQEVYLTAWKNIAKIRPRSFVGYLNTVTHNVCLRHYERTSRPREIPAPADDLEAAERNEKHEARAEHTADPAIITNTRDEQALLARALREVLDDRERDAAAEGSGVICRFDVPSGAYTLTATDLCGNIAEGTVTISLPPAEPTSLSDL